MRMRGSLVVVLLLAAGPLVADTWDAGSVNDDDSATANRLTHGSRQTHDLGFLPGPAADQDWYRLIQAAYTSHEVVVEALSPALLPAGAGNTDALLQLVDSAGTVLLDSEGADYAATNRSPIRVLSVENATQFETPRFVRVRSAGCTTACTSNDLYTVRARQTTYSIPRFNNSSTQLTIVILQSSLNRPVAGTLWFWGTGGTPLGSQAISLPSHGAVVLNTATVAGAGGASGTISLTHDAPYGTLFGKAVAVEPATGFTFDTNMVARVD